MYSFSRPQTAALAAWFRQYPVPASYLSVDVESSGLSPAAHRVLHVGWCTVAAGRAARSEGAVIDWTQVLDADGVARLDRDMGLARAAMAAKGQEYRWTVDALRARGAHPRAVAERLAAAFAGAPLAAHHGWGFDYPMLHAFFADQGVRADRPPEHYLDTCLMARALLAPCPPRPGEGYRAYVDRLLTVRCARHSLPHCVTMFGLDALYGADPKHAHDAEYDAWLAFATMERLRALAAGGAA